MDDTQVSHLCVRDDKVLRAPAEFMRDGRHVCNEWDRLPPHEEADEHAAHEEVKHRCHASSVPMGAPCFRHWLCIPYERLDRQRGQGREQDLLHVQHECESGRVQHQLRDVRRGGEPPGSHHQQSQLDNKACEHHSRQDEETLCADGRHLKQALTLSDEARSAPGPLVDGLQEAQGPHQCLEDVEEPHQEHAEAKYCAWGNGSLFTSKVATDFLDEGRLSSSNGQ
mmetsp:Transcript_4379/g.12051  ORF Transcript_4379/g.12051 Transcript_4379/m.12051 type:complete len:225 (-) Transcript_4379:109-783(-)